MSLLSRSMAMKFGIAAAVAALAAGGTVAGIAAASASASPAPRLTAAGIIDHQLCYNASPQGPFKIPPVILKNQFSPNGFAPQIGPVVLHCNPVAKTLPTGKVFPITNPNAHLLCWGITAPAQPTPMVKVTNQFGSAILQPAQPNMLCLPTWKSLTGPPNMPRHQPPGLSHFTCYPVRVVKGAYKPPPVMLQDEFAPKPVPAQVSPVPVELCLPTMKIVGTKVYKIVNAKWHLLCYPVTPTPIITPVFDQNQFVPSPPGGVPISIEKTNSLCVPSTKTIVAG
jgi:hypothetical protein